MLAVILLTAIFGNPGLLASLDSQYALIQCKVNYAALHQHINELQGRDIEALARGMGFIKEGEIVLK